MKEIKDTRARDKRCNARRTRDPVFKAKKKALNVVAYYEKRARVVAKEMKLFGNDVVEAWAERGVQMAKVRAENKEKREEEEAARAQCVKKWG